MDSDLVSLLRPAVLVFRGNGHPNEWTGFLGEGSHTGRRSPVRKGMLFFLGVKE